MLRSSRCYFKLLNTSASAIKQPYVAALRVLVQQPQHQQQARHFTATHVQLKRFEAAAEKQQVEMNKHENRSDNSAAEKEKRMAMRSFAQEFVQLLQQPAPQTPEEIIQQKVLLMEIINEGKSNPLVGFQRTFDACSAALEKAGNGQQLSSLDFALVMYLIVTTHRDYKELVGSLFKHKDSRSNVVVENVQRIRRIFIGEKLHSQCLLTVLSSHAKGKSSQYSRTLPAVFQGVMQSLIFESSLTNFSELERIKLVTTMLRSLCKYDIQEAQSMVFPTAKRAIDTFSDAEALHEHVLGLLVGEGKYLLDAFHASTLLELLELIQKFEQKYPDYEIDSLMVHQFFFSALQQGKSPQEQEKIMVTLLNYFFVTRPRRTVTADIINVIARRYVQQAIQIRDRLDAEKDDAVVWGCRAVPQILFALNEVQNKEQIAGIAKGLIARQKSGKIDMTTQPYLLWETDAQRKRLELTISPKVAKALEPNQELFNDWKKLIEEQLKVPLESAKRTSPPYKLVHIPEDKAPYLVKLTVDAGKIMAK